MTINVNSGSKDMTERMLSNLFKCEFFLDGFYFRSVEGLLQGIKFPPEDPRRYRAFSLCGIESKRLSAEAKNEHVWLLDGKEVPYNSKEHDELLERAIRAEFEQNPHFMNALLLTGNEPIIHEIGRLENPKTSLSKERFCQILTDIRAGTGTGRKNEDKL